MERVRRMPAGRGASESADDRAVHYGWAPAAGNAAMARLLGAATVSEPTDPLEREADRIADQIAGHALPGPGGPALSSAGQPLPETTRAHFESLLGHDLAAVRIRTDAAPARTLRARAFTVGTDITFGAGEYAPNSHRGRWLLAHELAHTVQPVADTVRRKEVLDQSAITGPRDWTTADREGNTDRWQAACLANLNAVDSSQYVKVVERRDFYRWFFEYTAAGGYLTRWALAAWIVSHGAHQVADMDVGMVGLGNDTFSVAGVELQAAMREGNQVIFDNVLPKLKKLLDGGPIKDRRQALEWDMQVLAEEQTLIQPLYGAMSPEALAQMDYIAKKKGLVGLVTAVTDDDEIAAGQYHREGIVPPFEGDLANARDRWAYGMKIGDQFATGGTGFDPKRDQMPAVGEAYRNGAEFGKVATLSNLHKLDAWLSPHRYSRRGPNKMEGHAYLEQIIGRLTPFEKELVLTDRSADGWAYTTQFAQFEFITKDLVAQALPADPARQAAVKAFLDRYAAERAKVPPIDPNQGVP